jgi:hypothetical protein
MSMFVIKMKSQGRDLSIVTLQQHAFCRL